VNVRLSKRQWAAGSEYFPKPVSEMHTDDLATLDEEGYCNIVGRVKDLISRGGENRWMNRSASSMPALHRPRVAEKKSGRRDAEEA